MKYYTIKGKSILIFLEKNLRSLTVAAGKRKGTLAQIAFSAVNVIFSLEDTKLLPEPKGISAKLHATVHGIFFVKIETFDSYIACQ